MYQGDRHSACTFENNELFFIHLIIFNLKTQQESLYLSIRIITFNVAKMSPRKRRKTRPINIE